MAMPEQMNLATPVGEVARLLRGTEPVTVHPEDALRAVAEVSVQHPECGVLLVVDHHNVLVGLIRATQLVNDIFVKIVPEEFLSGIGQVPAALDYARRLGARTAGDIMEAPVSVHAGQTVREAFRAMHETGLAGLPVVDEADRVEGYLDELELLLAWVETTGRQRLLEPPDGETDPGAPDEHDDG